jgi:hypothetical protein
MLVSKEKLEDIEARDRMLLDMHDCLLRYKETKDEFWMDRAKEWGEMSKMMDERIKKGEYKERDKRRLWIDTLLARFYKK